MVRKKGFTLIEMLVVVTIIGLLAALVVPNLFKRVGKTKRVVAKAQIDMFGTALSNYRLDNDVFPSTEQGLQALREKPSGEPDAKNWDGPYLPKDIPLDPWGNEYRYICPGEHGDFDIISYGRGGSEGGEGEDEDIVSWK